MSTRMCVPLRKPLTSSRPIPRLELAQAFAGEVGRGASVGLAVSTDHAGSGVNIDTTADSAILD
jgi:hypothetical protein